TGPPAATALIYCPGMAEARWEAAKLAGLCRECLSLGRDDHHPADAEAVDQHAEPLRKERLAKWHRHLAAVRQRGELAIGFGLVRDRQRQRKALEILLAAGGAAV